MDPGQGPEKRPVLSNAGRELAKEGTPRDNTDSTKKKRGEGGGPDGERCTLERQPAIKAGLLWLEEHDSDTVGRWQEQRAPAIKKRETSGLLSHAKKGPGNSIMMGKWVILQGRKWGR